MIRIIQNNNIIVHGVALQIFGLGVLIIGPSGIGKSDLALELVSRGHKFIVDDQVIVKSNHDKLTLATQMDPFMHIRGIGFINVEKVYGIGCIIKESNLDMIIELTDSHTLANDPLKQECSWTTYDKLKVKTFKLNRFQGRSLVTLIELLVKYQQDVLDGYDSHQKFLNYQQKLISQ